MGEFKSLVPDGVKIANVRKIIPGRFFTKAIEKIRIDRQLQIEFAQKLRRDLSVSFGTVEGC